MEDKQKVIFIEDDPNLGLIIVLALQSKGYEVCYANTLSGIQDMIEKDCPNILLLDLEVGNQNALDYLPFIRSKHPSLPVLIASSHNEGEEITRCYEAGANHYTKKPYDIQEIDFLIQRFCKKGSPISNSISMRLCQNRRSLFLCNKLKNIKQSPDFHKPGLCHVKKFL